MEDNPARDAIRSMKTAINARDYMAAVRNCRIVVEWLEQHIGPDNELTKQSQKILKGLILKSERHE